MESNYVATEKENYENIAETIRELTGEDETYTPSEMPDGIRAVYNAGGGSGSGGSGATEEQVAQIEQNTNDISELKTSAVTILTATKTLDPEEWVSGGFMMYGVTFEYGSPIGIGRVERSKKLKCLLVDISSGSTLDQKKAAEEACIYASYTYMEPEDDYDYFVYIGITNSSAPTVAIPITITAIFQE